MAVVFFVTHPDVVMDAALPVPRWPLSARGRARMAWLIEQDWAAEVAQVFSSSEQKALDGAAMMREALDIDHTVVAALGENDRSATGFLPPQEFQEVADRFFGAPDESIRGWERARDAQARIVGAVGRCLADANGRDPIAIVSHGGVGCLLLCHLLGEPISRRREQPGPPPGSPPGSGGGCFFVFDGEHEALLRGWECAEVPAPAPV